MEFLALIKDNIPLLYLGIVAIIAILILWRAQRHVTSVKERKLERLDKIKRLDPLPNDALTRRSKIKRKRKLTEQVDRRFSVIQKFLFGGVLTFAIIAGVMPFIGNIPSTMLSMFITAFTVILGIAARPYVENMISGVVISLSNQIRVGDVVIIDDHYGTVEDISPTHTKIKIWDWRRYVIPNSRMMTKEFMNLTITERIIWAYIEFKVAYDVDIEYVERNAKKIATQSDSFSDRDDPQFWVMRLEPDGVVCWIAAWAENPSSAWSLKSDMTRGLATLFREEGIATQYTRHGITHEPPHPEGAPPAPKGEHTVQTETAAAPKRPRF